MEYGIIKIKRRFWWLFFWKPKYIEIKVPKLVCNGLTEVRPTKYTVLYKVMDTTKNATDNPTQIIRLTKDELLNFKQDWWTNKNNKVIYPLEVGGDPIDENR